MLKYNEQEDAVWDMTKQELAEEIWNIIHACLPEYRYTGTDADFENHRRQMILYKAAVVLSENENIG